MLHGGRGWVGSTARRRSTGALPGRQSHTRGEGELKPEDSEPKRAKRARSSATIGSGQQPVQPPAQGD